MKKTSDLPKNLSHWAWQSLQEIGNRPAITQKTGSDETSFTYKDLLERSLKIARYLQHVTNTGDRVLLCEQPGIAFLSSLLGCFLAGRLVAPTFEMTNRRTIKRFEVIYQNFKPDFILSSVPIDGLKTPSIGSHGILQKNPPLFRVEDLSEASGDEAALVQYTSGSTSDPKGVVLSASQILHNLDAINRQAAFVREDPPCVVTWLPPYHDLGLFTHLLSTISVGGHTVVMRPIDFIRSPLNWLKAISDHQACYSSAPDFAYRNCLKRIQPAQIESLDLSSWRIAVNAAEPVHPETLDQFYDLCSPAGFKKESLMIAYGLAEATVLVTATPHEEAPKRISINKAAFHHNKVVLIDPDSPDALELVSSGTPIQDLEIRISDPVNEIGEIELRGPSIAKGYLMGNTDEIQPFADGWLKTGDLGFMYEDNLFITGRTKDLIILNGENFYPSDIEQVARQTIEADKCSSFALNGEEDVVLIIEKTRSMTAENFDHLGSQTYRAVLADSGIDLAKILFVKPNSLPMTSSGKIQRQIARDLVLDNDLPVLHSYQHHVEMGDLNDSSFMSLVAKLCEADPDTLSFDTLLTDLHFDSLNLLQLNLELEQSYGRYLNIDIIPEAIRDLYAQVEVTSKTAVFENRDIPLMDVTQNDVALSKTNWATLTNHYHDFLNFSGLLDDNPYQLLNISQRLYYFLPQTATQLLETAGDIHTKSLLTNWFWYLPKFQDLLRDWENHFPADFKRLFNELCGMKPGSILVLAHMHGWEWLIENILLIAQKQTIDLVLIADTDVVEQLLNKKRRYLTEETAAFYREAILNVDSPRFSVDLLNATNEGKTIVALPDTILASEQGKAKAIVPFLEGKLAIASGIFNLADERNLPVFHLDYRFNEEGLQIALSEITASVDDMVSSFSQALEKQMAHWAQWSILSPKGTPPRTTGRLDDEDFFERHGIIFMQVGRIKLLHSLPTNRTVEVTHDEFQLLKSADRADIIQKGRPEILALLPDMVI